MLPAMRKVIALTLFNAVISARINDRRTYNRLATSSNNDYFQIALSESTPMTPESQPPLKNSTHNEPAAVTPGMCCCAMASSQANPLSPFDKGVQTAEDCGSGKNANYKLLEGGYVQGSYRMKATGTKKTLVFRKMFHWCCKIKTACNPDKSPFEKFLKDAASFGRFVTLQRDKGKYIVPSTDIAFRNVEVDANTCDVRKPDGESS